MRSLSLTFQAYLAFAGKSFQKQMQYRVANLAGLTTNFFFLLVQVFVYAAFYKVSTEPQPLNLDEVITYFILCQASLMLMPLWGGSSEITGSIKDGSVALQLTKPVDFQTYWFADECGRACYYLIMRGLPTILLGSLFFKTVIPQQPVIFIFFAVSMLLAVSLSILITVVVYSAAFWMLDASGINQIGHTVITFFSGMLVPIALWPEWLAHIAGWLPFEGLIDVPFSIYLGKVTGVEFWMTISKQIAWNLFFLGFGRVLLNRGFYRLVIQGG